MARYPELRHPADEVWSQMSAYWVQTGQLDQGTVDTWAAGGRDEHSFFELGTRASYGDGWEMAPWSDVAGWGGVAAVGEAWGSGSPESLAGAWW